MDGGAVLLLEVNGTCLLVRLEDRSAEEVLAACAAAGVRVSRSRVIREDRRMLPDRGAGR